MSKTEKLNEEQVFKQEVADDELEVVAGGAGSGGGCTSGDFREIYEGGFPNCAASVEDGSWCGMADACVTLAVTYIGMTECKKAWK